LSGENYVIAVKLKSQLTGAKKNVKGKRGRESPRRKEGGIVGRRAGRASVPKNAPGIRQREPVARSIGNIPKSGRSEVLQNGQSEDGKPDDGGGQSRRGETQREGLFFAKGG